jgi:hypothetical protein
VSTINTNILMNFMLFYAALTLNLSSVFYTLKSPLTNMQRSLPGGTFANLLMIINLTKLKEGGSQVIGKTQFPQRVAF